MRRIQLGLLAIVLLVAASLTVLSAKPLVRAHGQFWGTLYFAGMPLDLQVAFNVQDRGEPGDDRGSISIRLFDQGSGKLAGVVLSKRVFDVHLTADGRVSFFAEVRGAGGDPLPGPPVWQFWAKDDGAADEFCMLNPFLEVLDRGKIVIRY